MDNKMNDIEEFLYNSNDDYFNKCFHIMKPEDLDSFIEKKNKLNLCSFCKKKDGNKKCPCYSKKYCSIECQQNDWKSHKPICKQIRNKINDSLDNALYFKNRLQKMFPDKKVLDFSDKSGSKIYKKIRNLKTPNKIICVCKNNKNQSIFNTYNIKENYLAFHMSDYVYVSNKSQMNHNFFRVFSNKKDIALSCNICKKQVLKLSKVSIKENNNSETLLSVCKSCNSDIINKNYKNLKKKMFKNN